MQTGRSWTGGVAGVLFLACMLRVIAGERDESMSGGATTVVDVSQNAFSQPAANLLPEHRADFFVGNSFFNQNWVAAPASTEARDGLGPLFNTRSCSACHLRDGRGAPPALGKPFHSMVLRISLPGKDSHGAPMSDPVYGGQIQGMGLPGIPAEGKVFVTYENQVGSFFDGETYTLRRPVYQVRNCGYGSLSPALRMSPRVAPMVFGLGLLEAVPDQLLHSMADPEDRDGDGISGRINHVWDAGRKIIAIGRFGWKAEQPTLLQQTAAAFREDMGLSTSMFPQENHTMHQDSCAKSPHGGQPEVSDRILESVVSYCHTLGVPAARRADDPLVQRGRRIFHDLQCAACHAPELKTGEVAKFPELSSQMIRPYTDLLLHDLGAELSDERPVFEASGREWRTPPLWGIGLIPKVNGHSTLLHDGRARNVTEAILWHGGEAEKSREAFRHASKADREALLQFLESL